MSDESVTAHATGVSPALRAQESPNDIVGHKTIYTGTTDPETGFPRLRHEPLTHAEAQALHAAADAAKQKRTNEMPDAPSAIRAMFEAWQRLKELGWREAQYCPKDGSAFEVIEAGSTGIFECRYSGEWPDGHYLIAAHGDIYPSRPILFRLYPEDQAKYDARIAAMREAFRNQPRGLSAAEAPISAERVNSPSPSTNSDEEGRSDHADGTSAEAPEIVTQPK